MNKPIEIWKRYLHKIRKKITILHLFLLNSKPSLKVEKEDKKFND